MLNKVFAVAVFMFVCCSALAYGQVSDEMSTKNEGSVIKGVISEISEDNSFIVVNGTKIMTAPGFVEDYFLLKGDEVEVAVNNTDKGLEAVDCNFTFEDETGTDTDEYGDEGLSETAPPTAEK